MLEDKLRNLQWELDMLAHALYLNRNAKLFRTVRAVYGK